MSDYTEQIARAICVTGKCTVCDKDCLDYKAAERITKTVIPDVIDNTVDEFINKLSEKYANPMYKKPGAHTMMIKLYDNIYDIKKEITDD